MGSLCFVCMAFAFLGLDRGHECALFVLLLLYCTSRVAPCLSAEFCQLVRTHCRTSPGLVVSEVKMFWTGTCTHTLERETPTFALRRASLSGNQRTWTE